MLRWVTALLAFGTIGFVLGFTSLLGQPIGLARILFGIYAGLLTLSLIVALVSGMRGKNTQN